MSLDSNGFLGGIHKEHLNITMNTFKLACLKRDGKCGLPARGDVCRLRPKAGRKRDVT